MRRPHVYERSVPRRRGPHNTHGVPGPYADGYAAQRRGAERDPPELTQWTDDAEDAASWRAGWLLGYDDAATDAEQDRKAQDRAWSERLGIARQ